jgi:hypothetical protein
MTDLGFGVSLAGSACRSLWERSRLKDAATAARLAGWPAIDADLLAEQEKYFTHTARTGIVLNAARRSKLQKKRHALATRMRDRAGDYLRFATTCGSRSTTTPLNRPYA